MANIKDLMGEDEVKIDGYVGTVLGNLTVVGWNGKHGNPKKYIVSCSVCKEDPELHGEGLFAMAKGHLERGNKPCGCTDKCNWTEEQYKVRAARACLNKGLVFKGWVDKLTTANKTKVVVECPVHGDFNTMVLSFILIDGGHKGCAGCFSIRMGDFKRKDDEFMINTFMSSGGFAQGTKFTRTETLDKYGHKKYWLIECPDCNTSGEAHMVGLYKGSRPCACAKSRPQETYINLIKDGENVVAIKFGVANLARERIKTQHSKSIYDIVNYGVWNYPTIMECKSAERLCLRSMETGVISKEEMPDGYTETTFPYNIDKVISIFEQGGGIRNI
jgi:hypothetical protein